MSQPTKPTPAAVKAEAAIAKLAQGYPEVVEENPWGHRAFKVRGKTYLFLGADGDSVSFSVKLPGTGVAALELEFTEPTHYGLGKSGWVTARFSSGRMLPMGLVREWLDESYAAIAPKKLSSALGSSVNAVAEPAARAKARSVKQTRKAPQGKAAAKKALAKAAPAKKRRTRVSGR